MPGIAGTTQNCHTFCSWQPRRLMAYGHELQNLSPIDINIKFLQI